MGFQKFILISLDQNHQIIITARVMVHELNLHRNHSQVKSSPVRGHFHIACTLFLRSCHVWSIEQFCCTLLHIFYTLLSFSQKVLRGKLYSKGYNGGKPFQRYTKLDVDTLPDSVDWRLYGAVTPVKGIQIYVTSQAIM